MPRPKRPPSGSRRPCGPADGPFGGQGAPLVAPKRQLIGLKLCGKRHKVYIGLMRQALPFTRFAPLIAAWGLLLPAGVQAQGFAADYDLGRSFEASAARRVTANFFF